MNPVNIDPDVIAAQKYFPEIKDFVKKDNSPITLKPDVATKLISKMQEALYRCDAFFERIKKVQKLTEVDLEQLAAVKTVSNLVQKRIKENDFAGIKVDLNFMNLSLGLIELQKKISSVVLTPFVPSVYAQGVIREEDQKVQDSDAYVLTTRRANVIGTKAKSAAEEEVKGREIPTHALSKKQNDWGNVKTKKDYKEIKSNITAFVTKLKSNQLKPDEIAQTAYEILDQILFNAHHFDKQNSEEEFKNLSSVFSKFVLNIRAGSVRISKSIEKSNEYFKNSDLLNNKLLFGRLSKIDDKLKKIHEKFSQIAQEEFLAGLVQFINTSNNIFAYLEKSEADLIFSSFRIPGFYTPQLYSVQKIFGDTIKLITDQPLIFQLLERKNLELIRDLIRNYYAKITTKYVSAIPNEPKAGEFSIEIMKSQLKTLDKLISYKPAPQVATAAVSTAATSTEEFLAKENVADTASRVRSAITATAEMPATAAQQVVKKEEPWGAAHTKKSYKAIEAELTALVKEVDQKEKSHDKLFQRVVDILDQIIYNVYHYDYWQPSIEKSWQELLGLGTVFRIFVFNLYGGKIPEIAAQVDSKNHLRDSPVQFMYRKELLKNKLLQANFWAIDDKLKKIYEKLSHYAGLVVLDQLSQDFTSLAANGDTIKWPDHIEGAEKHIKENLKNLQKKISENIGRLKGSPFLVQLLSKEDLLKIRHQVGTRYALAVNNYPKYIPDQKKLSEGDFSVARMQRHLKYLDKLISAK